MVYKPTYNWGAPPCIYIYSNPQKDRNAIYHYSNQVVPFDRMLGLLMCTLLFSIINWGTAMLLYTQFSVETFGSPIEYLFPLAPHLQVPSSQSIHIIILKS